MHISRRKFLKYSGTTIIASSLGGLGAFKKVFASPIVGNLEGDDLTLRLARKQNNSFYKWFYKNKTISKFNDIPVLNKMDLLDYETKYKKNYFGDVDPSEGFVIRETTTDRLKIPYHISDFEYAIPNFWEIPMLNAGNGLHIVTNSSFAMADFMDGAQGKSMVGCDANQNLDIVKSKLAEGKGKTILLIGDSAWIAWVIRRGLVTEDMVVCTMPKQGNYKPGHDPLDKVDNQIFVYCASEIGIVGYYTTRCAENCYHVYREDTIVEEVDGRLVVTNPRKAFDFIRYNTGDAVKLREIQCDCGFEGIGIQWIKKDKRRI